MIPTLGLLKKCINRFTTTEQLELFFCFFVFVVYGFEKSGGKRPPEQENRIEQPVVWLYTTLALSVCVCVLHGLHLFSTSWWVQEVYTSLHHVYTPRVAAAAVATLLDLYISEEGA